MIIIAALIIMPIITIVAGVKIYMYRKDHNPPHFHAQYSGDEEVFDFHGETLKGSIGSKKRKKVRKWAKKNRKLLENKWNEYNP